MVKILKCILFYFLLNATLNAQELPPVSVYNSKDYHAENQNWSISQGKDKHIYVANNKGLIEFDGFLWKLYPTPNETIIRSVKVIEDKIFTGFYSGFGYWTKNNFGVLEYTSLSEDIELLEDEQFWHIESVEGWMLFQSLQRIYLYNIKTKEYKVVSATSQITSMFKARNVIYYHETGKGIFKIDRGISTLVSNHKIFKNRNVVAVHDVDDTLIYVTSNSGIYYLKDGEPKSWNSKLNDVIKNYTFYSSIQLSSGSLVLGTISDGVLVLDNKANVKFVMNQQNGLSDNTVLSLFEDVDKNVWLGLDDGINNININSPFRVFKDVTGVLGTVYTSIVHNGFLYLGTNQGLFYKKEKTTDNFSFVKNTEGQVWTLNIINNNLLCGHNSGTFQIKNNEALQISDVMGTWKIKSISDDTFIQGNYSGLHIFKKKNNKWSFHHKIEGFNISSKYFEFLDKNTIFINHEYKGVYKLRINDDYTRITNVSILGSIEKGIHSSLLKYKGEILYSHKKGVYKFNVKEDKFIRDSLLSSYVNKEDFITGVLINMPSKNKLWGFSQKSICYIEQGGISDHPIINYISVPLRQRKGAFGYENICSLSKHEYLVGTSNGYVIADIRNVNKNDPSRIEINQIKNASINTPFKNIDLGSNDNIFKTHENYFEFISSVPNYSKFTQVEYQYQLLGLSDEWSLWKNTGNVFFENLPFGNYTFSIRAKINDQLSSNIASYNFEITKPWYISKFMIFTYILSVIIFSIFMHFMYNLYYAKQRQRLLRKKQNEFELERLENEKELTLLKNEKLEADMEIKSKELANSTMNIIKQNKLLNNIKSELLKGEQKNINTVINIVDDNLKNNNDWKLFEEAFNNADKNFIKKIKTLHPSLTSNDLRLCAYLRLNLSSKEIAPLLNISSKSVEVKRYRLRKKMNLLTEENLSDYILSM